MTTPPNHNTADQSGADERAPTPLTNAIMRGRIFYANVGDLEKEVIDHARNMEREVIVLREMLAASTHPAPQAAQEPIAYMYRHFESELKAAALSIKDPTEWLKAIGTFIVTPLYATPQPFPARAVQSGELPDLPEAKYAKLSDLQSGVDYYFDAGQMQAYARQAIAQTAPAVAGEAWLPIDTAPEGDLVVCMWLDKEDDEHPARYNFDYFEDGIWMNYFSEHEHYAIAGVAKGRSEDAPYTHWMPIPAAPSQGAKQ